MKESFVFYKSFYEAINKLPEEYQFELYKAITEYSFEGTISVELSPVAEAMFTLMKPNIDSASQRYEASVENGKKGGAPKGNDNAKKQPKNNLKQPKNNPKQPSDNLKQPNNNLNDNVDVDDNVNDNVDVAEEVKEEPATATDKVVRFYLDNINQLPTPNEIENLEYYQKQLSGELLIFGMQKAVDQKARKMAYCKKIWDTWISKGITTLAEAKEETKQYSNKAPPIGYAVTAINKYFDDTNMAQYTNLDRFYAN